MTIVPTSSRSRFPVALLLHGCVFGAVLAVVMHFSYVLLGSNFRTVVPRRVYRCGQPSGKQLERFIRKYGIRTVVNLRGCCVGAPWYHDEACVTGTLGVSQEDLGFSAGRLPSTSGLRQLVEVLDRSEYPILLHCHQGADRTGLAAVVYLLLQTGATLPEARRQLGPSRGHLPLGRTHHIDAFFDLYSDWLASRRVEHSSTVFRQWVRDGYCPAEGRAEFTLVDNGPLRLRVGERRLVKVRCRNTSIRPWQFQPGINAGIHATWFLIDENETNGGEGRVGLFEATVQPGETIDLMIPLVALWPGHFQLRVDLFSARHASFLQLGNDLLVVNVEVL